MAADAGPDGQVVVALVADLIFQSKMQAAASGVGVSLVVARTAEQLASHVDRAGGVLLDLAADGVDPIALIHKARAGRPGLKIVGFLPHVEVELAAAARAAGADNVLPRSAFAARLPEILKGLASAE